jgi:acetylornithine deacetylase
MKGFFAALLVGLDQVDLNSLSAPVRVLASYDEEVGCAGVRQVLPALAEEGPLDPALIIIGEPTGMRPGRSHPGKRVVRLEVTAAEMHSSKAADYPSAISGAAALVQALDEIQDACPPALPGEGPMYSLNVGTISGGSQANLIAGSCALVYEIRFALDQDPEQILAPLREAITEANQRLAPHGEVAETELFNYPALYTDPTHPVFAEAERLADNGPATGVGFGTEGGLLSTVFPSPIMICGPGHIAHAHQPNEYVTLEQLNRCVQFVSSIIRH